MRGLAILLGTFALISCGQEREPSPEPEPLDQRKPLSPLVTQYDDLAAVVSANGVAAFQGDIIGFGTERSQVDAALQTAFGTEAETSSNAECGAGPMEFSRFGPLLVGYMDDRLAGWYLEDNPIGGEGGKDGVASTDGVRPGVTTLVQLKDHRAVRMIDSTLSGEFQYETGDYGLIGGFSDGDRITALQAGIACVFR